MKSALLLFVLFPLAFSSISFLGLSGSLGEGGRADLLVIAQFNDSAGKTVFLNVSGPVEVVVKDKTGLVLEHQLVKSGNWTLIYAAVPLDYLQYEITSDSLTRKEGSLWDFNLGISSSERITSFNSTLDMPKGTVLKSTNGAVTDSGGMLSLSWKASNISPNQTARMRASYEIAPQEDSTLLYGILAIVVAAALLIALHLFRPKPVVKSPETVEKPPGQDQPPPEKSLESNAVFKTLDEIDKEILREIASQGGKTTQAKLYLNTHLPKATLSRRLSSLENRGIIQKSQRGNRNLITLSDALK